MFLSGYGRFYGDRRYKPIFPTRYSICDIDSWRFSCEDGVFQMNFKDAMYWFFMQPSVVIVSVGSVTAVIVLISLLLILRKWGDYA
jgi:hypothetical protein